MNENIDLTKILKNCPTGTKLYSTTLGYVTFREIDDYDATYPIVVDCKDKIIRKFTTNGEIIKNYDGECTLFPSKEQRDWSKFTAPWYKNEKFDPKTLKPFDKVLIQDIYEGWACSIFSHIKESEYPYSTASGSFKICIPYNDDTKNLVGTTEEAPEYYRYWED